MYQGQYWGKFTRLVQYYPCNRFSSVRFPLAQKYGEALPANPDPKNTQTEIQLSQTTSRGPAAISLKFLTSRAT